MLFNFKETVRKNLSLFQDKLDRKAKEWNENTEIHLIHETLSEFFFDFFKNKPMLMTVINSNELLYGCRGFSSFMLKLEEPEDTKEVCYASIKVCYNLGRAIDTLVKVEIYTKEDLSNIRKHLLSKLQSENAETFISGILISNDDLSENLLQ